MFEIPKKTRTKPQRHPWVKSDNEIQVYDAVMARVSEVKALIADANTALKPSQYKIAKSAICKSLGLSGGYISKHPKLFAFTKGHQRDLERMACEVAERSQTRGYQQKAPEKMCKEDLVKELKRLRKRLNERESELYVEQLVSLLDNGISETQVITRQRMKSLRQELVQARALLEKREGQVTDITDALAESEKRRLDLARQLKALGIEPNQKLKLRSI